MRRLMLMVLACLTVGTAAAAQTAPCSAPVDQLVVNPTRLNLVSADHMTFVFGSTTEWLIASYEIRYYAEGATSPFQTFTYPRAALTPTGGVVNCYGIAQTSWPISPNVRYRAVAIAKTNPVANVADSLPSEESNPFGVPGSPRRLATFVQ